ncbi:hypothetical protein [Pseudoteredinibacter isoporae]|uniref:hypothetical protein n=1 Tax=Pseudoteredinibacter isoporae TaxID=570281 RepID=UPI003341B8F5
MKICVNLDKRDLPFFTLFGFLISSMMWWVDKFNLPAHMERGYLVDLLFDHIPFISIATLLVVMALIELLSIAISTQRAFLVRQNIHIARRISQFSSPAFFIVIGFSIPVLFAGAWMRNVEYISQFFILLQFSLMIWLLSFLSSQIVHQSKFLHEAIPRGVAVLIIFAILGATILIPGFNGEPKSIRLDLDLGTYQMAEKAAESRNMTIDQYIQFSVNSQLNEYNDSKQ